MTIKKNLTALALTGVLTLGGVGCGGDCDESKKDITIYGKPISVAYDGYRPYFS